MSKQVIYMGEASTLPNWHNIEQFSSLPSLFVASPAPKSSLNAWRLSTADFKEGVELLWEGEID